MSKKWIPNFVRKPVVSVLNALSRFNGRVYMAARSGKIWFPDKAFQKWDYKVHCGKKLSFRNPQTYCEKLQWMKYYYRNPALTQLVDKYAVREYVANLIGEEYLVPLYGVWEHFDDIDFDALPNSFVLKCTHDQGSVILVPDKAKLDMAAAREKLEIALGKRHFYLSREWPYKNVPPRIICEQFLSEDGKTDLVDYKFMCFSGVPKIMYTGQSRSMGLKMDYYDMEWNLLPFNEIDGVCSDNPLPKPECFEQMKVLAEKLSAGLPHVRVDFYDVNGKIYFGELTLFNSGGRKPFVPEQYELEIGSWITLPPKMR